MIKPAFSTVACPEWTLEQVASAAKQFGFSAVELRTFGPRSSNIACDPSLTAHQKVRSLFDGVGVEIASLATSVRFDQPVNPPVIGEAVSDSESSIRAAKQAIDLAAGIGCPLVRVFGFDLPPRQKRPATLARIVGRLAMVLDHARNTGVRVVIENGGAFPRAADVAEILDQTNHPLLGVSYSLPVGVQAGDTPDAATAALGSRLWLARIKDFRVGQPCRLGDGDLPCREFVSSLTRVGFTGSVVYEWDRLWMPQLASADEVLPHVASTMYQWASAGRPGLTPVGAR
ncbi:MAG: sugar phosphate isomerase/epimerase [Pyrinomonadaceae bacterium]|nr:sugar phosphate isomerase/epimerase [Phycisphaerales bacterium]